MNMRLELRNDSRDLSEATAAVVAVGTRQPRHHRRQNTLKVPKLRNFGKKLNNYREKGNNNPNENLRRYNRTR